MEGLTLEERDIWLLEIAAGVQFLHLFVGGLFCAFEFTIREEQKQGLQRLESSKGRAATFATASYYKGI